MPEEPDPGSGTSPALRFDVLTIFPELVRGYAETGILRKGREAGRIEIHGHDLRDWAGNKHKTVDDYPYGGGGGMLMRAEPFLAGIEAVRAATGSRGRVLLTSARGKTLDQDDARRLVREPHLILLCGHYKGIDARVDAYVDEEVSLGDFCLSGGELVALAVVDAVARLVPGVAGNLDSIVTDSHWDGLLSPPEYTRPEEVRGARVPEVLLSGHHARIEKWRGEQALELTRTRRPDLYARWLARRTGGGPT